METHSERIKNLLDELTKKFAMLYLELLDAQKEKDDHHSKKAFEVVMLTVRKTEDEIKQLMDRITDLLEH